MATTEYRILEIDDDPLMRAVIASALGIEPSFSIFCCASGEEGLAKAASWSPDLILCDFSMPGLDGPDVLARLRDKEATASIPFIFTSASTDTAAVDAMRALGVTAVIAKPFKLRTVIAVVRCALFIPEAGSATTAPPAYDFIARMREDAALLREFHRQLADGAISGDMKDCVHRMAGAAGIYGFNAVSTAASAVERGLADYTAEKGSLAAIGNKLTELIKYVECHTE